MAVLRRRHHKAFSGGALVYITLRFFIFSFWLFSYFSLYLFPCEGIPSSLLQASWSCRMLFSRGLSQISRIPRNSSCCRWFLSHRSDTRPLLIPNILSLHPSESDRQVSVSCLFSFSFCFWVLRKLVALWGAFTNFVLNQVDAITKRVKSFCVWVRSELVIVRGLWAEWLVCKFPWWLHGLLVGSSSSHHSHADVLEACIGLSWVFSQYCHVELKNAMQYLIELHLFLSTSLMYLGKETALYLLIWS